GLPGRAVARLCPGAADEPAVAGLLCLLRRAAWSDPGGGGVRHLHPARLAAAPGRARRRVDAPLRRRLHHPLYGAGLGHRLWRLYCGMAARGSRATLAGRGRADPRLDETGPPPPPRPRARAAPTPRGPPVRR